MPQTFIFIGRSGCGKGTQATLLSQYLEKTEPVSGGVLYVETGAKFRDFIKGQTYSQQLSKKLADQAIRQPAFLAIVMWCNTLVENFTGQEHLIIDGSPRTLPEAEALDSAFDFYSLAGVTVIYINVSRDESIRRLTDRGRADDSSLEMINRRLDWFDIDVMPALYFFKNNNKYRFIEVNGEQSVEDIHQDIVSRLV